MYIRAGRLITGADHEVVEDGAVRIEEGKIVAAGPATEVLPPAGAEASVVRYDDATILPGLIDAHVHLTIRRGETVPRHAAEVTDEQALLLGVRAARQVLAAGVTTVRDCAARGRHAQALRDAVEEGIIAGPRILASGKPITTTAGHIWPISYEADSVTEVRRAVRQLVKEGVDFIKVCATGGRMTPGSIMGRAQYSVEELRAVVEDAHRFGLHVAAHALGTEGIVRAVEAGIDTIEHCTWLDLDSEGVAFDEEAARMMAAQGTVANFASNPPWQLLEEYDEAADQSLSAQPAGLVSRVRHRWQLVKRMRTLGVPVCFATDSGYGAWRDFHDLSYLAQVLVEQADFEPLDVIEMLTAAPAQAIGWGDRLGTLAPGKIADLLVVSGNPASDIRALHQVQAVYQGGVLAVGS